MTGPSGPKMNSMESPPEPGSQSRPGIRSPAFSTKISSPFGTTSVSVPRLNPGGAPIALKRARPGRRSGGEANRVSRSSASDRRCPGPFASGSLGSGCVRARRRRERGGRRPGPPASPASPARAPVRPGAYRPYPSRPSVSSRRGVPSPRAASVASSICPVVEQFDRTLEFSDRASGAPPYEAVDRTQVVSSFGERSLDRLDQRIGSGGSGAARTAAHEHARRTDSTRAGTASHHRDLPACRRVCRDRPATAAAGTIRTPFVRGAVGVVPGIAVPPRHRDRGRIIPAVRAFPTSEAHIRGVIGLGNVACGSEEAPAPSRARR